MTTEQLQEQISESSGWIYAVKEEMGRVLVGQEVLVDRLLVGLLCNGHILLEGVPGLAKTLAVKALSGSLSTVCQNKQAPEVKQAHDQTQAGETEDQVRLPVDQPCVPSGG